METVLKIVLYVDAILLILAVLSQQRGSNLSITFGGSGEFYKKKRGPEKVLEVATIVFSVLFVVLALVIPFSTKISSFF